MISWNKWYSIKSYIRSALWIVPFLALICFQVLSRVVFAIDDWLLRSGYIDQTTSLLGYGISGARATLETIITMDMSFIVFT